MNILVVTGTGTGVGKTVVTAAVAVLALARGERTAILKPAQTGVSSDEPGDAAEAARLAGAVTPCELARYPEPLAPATAARRQGEPGVAPVDAAKAAAQLAETHDTVLIEGAGGLLVALDSAGGTIADVAVELRAPVLVVARAGLGTLNATALTTEAIRARGGDCMGVVVGSWPRDPDLAARCNAEDLPGAAGAPLLGAVPAGLAALSPARFRSAAARSLAPELGGQWDRAAAASSRTASSGVAP